MTGFWNWQWAGEAERGFASLFFVDYGRNFKKRGERRNQITKVSTLHKDTSIHGYVLSLLNSFNIKISTTIDSIELSFDLVLRMRI